MDVTSFFRRQPLAPVTGLPPDAIPVTASRQLLEGTGCAPAVRQIRQLSGLPPAHWQSLVVVALHRYAAFAQQIPLPGGEAGTVLEAALRRAVAALRFRRGRMLPPGAAPEAVARGADRWSYGVLTAALFHGIGERLLSRELQMLDAAGRPLGRWNPWQGPMAEVEGCASYRVGQGQAGVDHPGRGVLFVSQLIPARGLEWLAEDVGLLDAWLGGVAGNWEGAGALGQILGQAAGLESAAGDHPAAETSHFQEPPEKPPASSADGSVMEPVDQFLKWLGQGLTTGSLPINRPGSAVYGVNDSVLLVNPDIFKAYRKAKPGVGDLATLRKRFLKRGLHRVTAAGGHSVRFSQRSGEALEGYLVPIQVLGLDQGVGTGDLRGPLAP